MEVQDCKSAVSEKSATIKTVGIVVSNKQIFFMFSLYKPPPPSPHSRGQWKNLVLASVSSIQQTQVLKKRFQ